MITRDEAHEKAKEAVQAFLMGMSMADNAQGAQALFILANMALHAGAALTNILTAASVCNALSDHFETNPPLPIIELVGSSAKAHKGNKTFN